MTGDSLNKDKLRVSIPKSATTHIMGYKNYAHRVKFNWGSWNPERCNTNMTGNKKRVPRESDERGIKRSQKVLLFLDKK